MSFFNSITVQSVKVTWLYCTGTAHFRILLALNKERYFLPSNFYCGSENLPTKIKNALECANYFKSLFPLADPDFLDAAGKKLSSKPQSTRFSWIEQLLESKSNDLVAKKKEFDAKKVSNLVLSVLAR